MLGKILRASLLIVGFSIGYGLSYLLSRLDVYSFLFRIDGLDVSTVNALHILLALVLAMVFYRSTEFITEKSNDFANETAKELLNIPPLKGIAGFIGLLGGVMMAFLLSPLITLFIKHDMISALLTLLIYMFLGYMGAKAMSGYISGITDTKSMYEVSDITNVFRARSAGRPKILDTSSIIDGRISDVLDTDFVEGEIVIPEFVLKELRHIADSYDPMKRMRGRVGLDVLNKIQSNKENMVVISSIDFPEETEVDIKLLKMAQKLNGVVVTNDYNLNKVAQIHGVKVLNVNDLSNALKPVSIPGESMRITVVKEGKEYNQGVAYLEDGTMIVVEDGRSFIGQEIDALVTSVLQTSAGRMIFVRPKDYVAGN